MTLSSPNLKVILFTTYHDANIAFLFKYFREYFVSGCNYLFQTFEIRKVLLNNYLLFFLNLLFFLMRLVIIPLSNPNPNAK